MDSKALAAVIKGIAPVVREFVLEALGETTARLKALESREPVAGPVGPAGPAGPVGERGEKGDPGERGADGGAGVDGAAGARGEPGPPGPPGEKGLDGAPGRDGRDGTPGRDGERGEKGLDGVHGKDGAPGRDGTLENLKVVQVSDRVIRFCFKDGTPIEGGEIRFGHPIDRGLFKATDEYEQGDVVSYGGALWIAQRSTKEVPGTGAPDVTGWRMSVPRGRDGKQGPPGAKGEFVTVKAGR